MESKIAALKKQVELKADSNAVNKKDELKELHQRIEAVSKEFEGKLEDVKIELAQ